MATPVLTALISTKNSDKDTLQQKVNDGEGAKGELSEVLGELDTLAAIQAIHDTALARATAMVTGSKTAVAPLQSSSTYTGTSAAITAGLTARQKDEAGMTGIVNTAPPNRKAYPDYVTARSKAATALATAVPDEATKRITLAAKRGMIDVRIASLTSYATDIAARFAQATAFLTSAALAAKSNSVAAAWWAFFHVKALLVDVSAADATALATALDTACDEYATAYSDWIAARDTLDQALTARASADADLATADAQTLAALAAFVG
jgi:hypothetical protein